MSQQLLLIALGPVQQFIDQARRMRDLWFGSHLLGEMSRAVARSLAANGWKLVYPALSKEDPELARCKGTRRPRTDAPPLGIGNKIIAIHASPTDPALAAAAARAAAIETWQFFAGLAEEKAGGLLLPELSPDETPRQVIESVLECYAAWTTFATDADFELARREAEQAVAARKTLRDFRAWSGHARRKSSLDGQRETILRDPASRDKKLVARYRIPTAEHLDGIGFVKRAGGEPEQFVPIARVTVEPWLREALACRPLFKALKSIEVDCARAGISGCKPNVTAWLGHDNFLCDGELFFEGQWPALNRDFGLHEPHEKFLPRTIGPLFDRRHRLPPPHPYVACLSADGDRMGKALGSLPTSEGQQKLSKALAGFSQQVRAVVEQHCGLLIFAGGDDVLAVLPVLHAVDCAAALRALFSTVMQEVFPDDTDTQPPTLSVGIGIAHFITPLGQIIRLARDAEKLAKQGDGLPPDDPDMRNALAVILDKRSGGTTAWRGRWDGTPAPDERLKRLRELVEQGRMPAKLPYDLDRVRRAMGAAQDDNRALGRAWCHEVKHIVAHKFQESGTAARLQCEEIGLALPAPDKADLKAVRTALSEWVNAALIAAALSDAAGNVRAVRERARQLESGHDD